MKLLDVVQAVSELSGDAPYAIVGGLAQILWARKSHTDDLDVALSSTQLGQALTRVRSGAASGWALPAPPDEDYEQNDVFEVAHVLFQGVVVDLLAFRDASFNSEIIASARVVPELGGLRFIRPELLLVTHLLRPGPAAAIAAVELVIARRAREGFDVAEAHTWAERLGRTARLERVLEQAKALEST